MVREAKVKTLREMSSKQLNQRHKKLSREHEKVVKKRQKAKYHTQEREELAHREHKILGEIQKTTRILKEKQKKKHKPKKLNTPLRRSSVTERSRKYLVVSKATGIPIHSSDTKTGATKWRNKFHKNARVQKNPKFKKKR